MKGFSSTPPRSPLRSSGALVRPETGEGLEDTCNWRMPHLHTFAWRQRPTAGSAGSSPWKAARKGAKTALLSRGNISCLVQRSSREPSKRPCQHRLGGNGICPTVQSTGKTSALPPLQGYGRRQMPIANQILCSSPSYLGPLPLHLCVNYTRPEVPLQPSHSGERTR